MLEAKNVTNEAGELGSDLVWGAQAIAQDLGLPVRKVIHLIDREILPTGKIGGRVVASRKKLRAFIEAAVAW
jgi:hypothetical protein